jgi:hypothetical protein
MQWEQFGVFRLTDQMLWNDHLIYVWRERRTEKNLQDTDKLS